MNDMALPGGVGLSSLGANRSHMTGLDGAGPDSNDGDDSHCRIRGNVRCYSGRSAVAWILYEAFLKHRQWCATAYSVQTNVVGDLAKGYEIWWLPSAGFRVPPDTRT